MTIRTVAAPGEGAAVAASNHQASVRIFDGCDTGESSDYLAISCAIRVVAGDVATAAARICSPNLVRQR